MRLDETRPTCGVVLLDIPENSDIFDRHKVDGDTLPTEPTGSTYPVQVVLTRRSEAVQSRSRKPEVPLTANRN
jgi:hypothetical protein